MGRRGNSFSSHNAAPGSFGKKGLSLISCLFFFFNVSRHLKVVSCFYEQKVGKKKTWRKCKELLINKPQISRRDRSFLTNGNCADLHRFLRRIFLIFPRFHVGINTGELMSSSVRPFQSETKSLI